MASYCGWLIQHWYKDYWMDIQEKIDWYSKGISKKWLGAKGSYIYLPFVQPLLFKSKSELACLGKTLLLNQLSNCYAI